MINLVKKDGVITFAPHITDVLSILKDGEYTVTITNKKEKRSLRQNSLMWLWFNCIRSETGTELQDIHDYYCNLYLCRNAEIFGEIKVVQGSTSTLNKEEFKEFLNKIQADAAQELGIILPCPEDRYFSEFYERYKL